MQAYMYFPSKDKALLQIIAAGMAIVDIVSAGLISRGVYAYLVPNFGSMLPLASINPALSAECSMSIFIVFVSHLFFAYQMYNVIAQGPAKYVMPGLVAFFGTVSFAGAIGCVVTMFTQNRNILTDRSYQFSVFVGIAKGAAAVADIIATAGLCFYISKGNSAFKKTNSMIKRLIGYILQRGILVTLIQIMFLIIFFTTSTKFAWLALHVNVTRIYSNTFFAMLNGRASLKTEKSFNVASSSNKSATYNNDSQELKFIAVPNSNMGGSFAQKGAGRIKVDTSAAYSYDA